MDSLPKMAAALPPALQCSPLPSATACARHAGVDGTLDDGPEFIAWRDCMLRGLARECRDALCHV